MRTARWPTGDAHSSSTQTTSARSTAAHSCFEAEGRLEEAAGAWQSILACKESRGYVLQTVWPMQERERLCPASGNA